MRSQPIMRWSHFGFFALLGLGFAGSACGDDAADDSPGPGTGGAGGGGVGGGGSGGEAPWTNPGCEAPANVVSPRLGHVEVAVDLTHFDAREYDVRQSVTVRPETPGDAVTLFGSALLLGEASHGYAYDGQRATFCVPPFEAGDEITLEIEYVVSEAHQAFPAGNTFGLQWWGNPAGEFSIGTYSSPFFTPTWLLAPHTMPWIDPERDDNASVDSVALEVVVPDASWTVVGPGHAQVEGDTWRFTIDGTMPLYSLAFSASPAYVTVDGATTSSGVELSAAVFPSSDAAIAAHLGAASDAIEWMDAHIAPYPWPTALTFAEVPGYPGGFEHTSAVWLGSVVIDGGDDGDLVAVHEVVHHWWGNDVRIADWTHFWLSEGFADWTTTFAIFETLDPALAAAEQRSFRIAAANLSYPATASHPMPGPLRFTDPGEFVDQLQNNGLFFYRYGAAFLEMVHQRLVRDYDTDLPALLSIWHEEQHGQAVTTEQFRDFLIARTGDTATWTELFDQWVYATPCPTLEITDYAYTPGQATFEVNRTGGAGQDLSELEVAVASVPPVTVTVPLPAGSDTAIATLPVPNEPTAIAIDPEGLYIIRLDVAPGWAGPTVGNTLP